MDGDRAILDECVAEFRKTKHNAERCLAQLTDEQLHVRINPQQNSIAVIIQHLHGNMISRWSDFLTSDGEKPTRDREGEFVEHGHTRDKLLAMWEAGWSAMFDAIAPLTDADLSRIVHIRREPHTVFRAINRQTAHYNLHLGQIQVIAKHLRGNGWEYVSIAPGGSAAFNAKMGMR